MYADTSQDRSRTQPGQAPDAGTLNVMDGPSYDLWFDPNAVDRDLMVECWISHGPRAEDPSFDPRTGDEVLVSDDEEQPSLATVIRRESNRVWVHIHVAAHSLGGSAHEPTTATG